MNQMNQNKINRCITRLCGHILRTFSVSLTRLIIFPDSGNSAQVSVTPFLDRAWSQADTERQNLKHFLFITLRPSDGTRGTYTIFGMCF